VVNLFSTNQIKVLNLAKVEQNQWHFRLKGLFQILCGKKEIQTFKKIQGTFSDINRLNQGSYANIGRDQMVSSKKMNEMSIRKSG
jgi:hypothetical protein